MSRDIKEEYKSQFFGFTKKSVVDAICMLYEDIVKSGIADMKIKLRSKVEDENMENFEEMLKKWEEMYLESGKTTFKDLDIIVENAFGISDNILLPEDEIQKTQYTKEFEENVDKDLELTKANLKMLGDLDNHLSSVLDSVTGYEQVLMELKAAQKTIISVEDAFETLQEKMQELTVAKETHCTAMKNFKIM